MVRMAILPQLVLVLVLMGVMTRIMSILVSDPNLHSLSGERIKYVNMNTDLGKNTATGKCVTWEKVASEEELSGLFGKAQSLLEIIFLCISSRGCDSRFLHSVSKNGVFTSCSTGLVLHWKLRHKRASKYEKINFERQEVCLFKTR